MKLKISLLMIIQTAVVRCVPYTFLVLALHFLSISLFAQKQFNLTIQLPKGINQENLEVWLNNGKTDQLLNAKSSKEGRISLTGDYYGLYAAVSLQYISDPLNAFSNTFFVKEKKAIVTFNPSTLPSTPFGNCSLMNAWDFKAEKTGLDEYVYAERKKAIDYEAKYGEQIFSGSDTAIRNHYFNLLVKELGRKQLEYVLGRPNSYYCFYIFRSVLARPVIAPADSLLYVFNRFADRFRLSDEGNYLNQSLRGYLVSGKKGGDAISFVSRDINKRTITLGDFIGKKYVLLHFWATWCTPCMRELPAVKQISSQYASKDLQIISIAVKSNEADHRKTISKYGMDWIQIYNDPDLLHKYGDLPVPRICLIDKSGKVVYDDGLRENEDIELNGLREKLKDVMQR
jgi:thiol-disulfide isomerase/thioredoxin